MLPDLTPSKIRAMHQLVGPESVNLGLGQPIIDTPQELVGVVDQVMREDDLGYTAFSGIPTLREMIAQRVMGAQGRMENVCITTGTTEALFAGMLTVLQPGDEVLVPDPGFVSYQAVSRIAGATPVAYPVPAVHGFQLDVETVESLVTPNTRALIINSPNNPTGRIISRDALVYLGKLADKHDFYIFSEEVYSSINFTGTAASAWGVSDRVFVVDGVSKIYGMTGWRLGWIVGDEPIIRDISTMHHYMVACAPAIAQRVLIRLWEGNGELGTVIRNKLQHEYNRRRNCLVRGIAEDLGWEYVPPDGAFYLMVQIPPQILDGKSSEAVAKELVRQKDVITIPGSAFGTEGEGFLRLSFAVQEETLRSGVELIRQYAMEKGI